MLGTFESGFASKIARSDLKLSYAPLGKWSGIFSGDLKQIIGNQGLYEVSNVSNFW